MRIFPEEKPTTIANPELQTGYYFNFTPVRFCCHIEKRNHIGANFISFNSLAVIAGSAVRLFYTIRDDVRCETGICESYYNLYAVS